jgi:hypothetical protein
MGSQSVLRFAAWGLWAVLAASVAVDSSAPAYGDSEGSGSGKGEAEKSSGSVVSTKAQSVELKVDDNQLTFYAAKTAKGIVETIGQLAPQDNVTITWRQKSDKKWIEKIEGRGTLQGLVTAKADTWIEVTPDKGAPQKFMPAWVGGAPADGGGLDKNMLKKISKSNAGDKVRVTWEISEGKRVVDVKVLARAPNPAPTAKAPRPAPQTHPASRAWIWRARHLP